MHPDFFRPPDPPIVPHVYFAPDGATHVLMGEPGMCGQCEKPHSWFVNRQGSTRCLLCDLENERREHGIIRLRSVEAAREAFRLFRSQPSPEAPRP